MSGFNIDRRVQPSAELHRISANLAGSVEASCSLLGIAPPTLPVFGSVGEVKQFCVGLLDPGNPPHPLREWAGRLDGTVRASFCHSLFLFRKTLPSGSESEAVSSFLRKMTTPSAKVDPSFLEFISKTVPQIFRSGWDSAYQREAFSLSPPTSSSITTARKVGGVRGSCSASSRGAAAYSRGLLRYPLGRIPRCRVQAVPDGGKWRVVTVNPDDCLALRPLHHVLYNHLSRQEWLLRGDASARRFKDFSLKEGEVFVSGDYEAATDNIPLEVYRALLGAVRSTSLHVPSEVWDLASAESRKLFVDKRGRFLGVQERGQLMGSYLSFPFLCLLNYLCFKYAVRRKCPVRINGDDIVFRATVRESEKWFESVKSCGLVVSRGKTLVDRRIFTLNSSLFRAREGSCAAVGFFRPCPFFKDPGGAAAAAGQFGSLVVGFPGSKAKDEIQRKFLVRNAKYFRWSQLSLLRDLHMRVSDKVLRTSGFYDRERFYLGLPAPTPSLGCVPGGFHQVTLPRSRCRKSALRVEERLFFQELTELSWLGWSPPPPEMRGLYAYVRLRVVPGRWVPLGFSAHLGRTKDYRGEGREKVWAARSVGTLRSRPLTWVSGGFQV
nr:MAG: RNA dependent RNA polymerase [Ustilaginoidea virens botourmiavirus 1]